MTETEDYAETAAPEAHAESHEDGGSDEITVEGLTGELAEEQNSAWTKVSGKPATFPPDSTLTHKDSHEDGGSDEIDVTGLVGTTPRAILGDVTPGRKLRAILLWIYDGTDPATLKAETRDLFNGDVISIQDNIAKGATTGFFDLTSTGKKLTIRHEGLTGHAYFAIGILASNNTGTTLYIKSTVILNGIAVLCRHPNIISDYDITVLVDSNPLSVYIIYITDA